MRFLNLFLWVVLIVGIHSDHFTSVSYQEVLKDPFISYRKGHYRYIVDYFDKNPKKANTLDKQYVWASSYLELRDYSKAFELFRKIDYKELYRFKDSFLYPFFVRKYLQILIKLENKNILTESEKKDILDMIEKVPYNSPIRKYLDQELFTVLWTTESYNTILLLNENLSDTGKAWLELTKSKLGQPYNIKIIINNQSSFKKIIAYEHLLATLDPIDFSSKVELNNLVEMNLRVPEYRDKALEFAKRYKQLHKDHAYYTKILAQQKILDKNKQGASKVVYDYIIQNPKSSLKMYIYAYEFLVKNKQFEYADEISEIAYKQYKHKFYQNVKNGIEFHENSNYVLSWYKKNYKNISIDQHLQVVRSLIRTDMKKAEEVVDLGLSVNQNHPKFLLMYALIKEHFGKKQEAYKYYLRLIFQEAFGYSGIVAKSKEKQMRNEFREHFDKVVKDVVESIPNFKIQDRLMLYKSFLVDDELKQYVDHRAFKQDQQVFNKLVYKDLNKVKDVPILEKYPKNLRNFSPETQDYIENAILDAMKGDPNWHNTARYFYKYRDIFINSDIEGYLTFRMYFYIRDQYGYTYVPNYPKEIIDIVFPKPEFELIKKWSDNDKDLAYWMLSSFMAESHFRKRVYSTVGAVGFAQVMPYTAIDIKRWLKKPYLSNYDFYDNMRMGVYYHKKMYDLMDGNVLLSLAAYNAGPGSVNRWKKKYSHLKDDYLFIEAIDYEETRKYVEIIIYNHGMYRLLNDNDLYQ